MGPVAAIFSSFRLFDLGDGQMKFENVITWAGVNDSTLNTGCATIAPPAPSVYVGRPVEDRLACSSESTEDFDEDDFDDDFDDDFEEEWDEELPGDADQFEPDEKVDNGAEVEPDFDDED
jgi:hypothetical protein